MIHQILNRRRLNIKSRHRRKDNRPSLRDGRHILQMHRTQRRLPDSKHQAPSLFKHNICSPRDQIIAEPGANRRKRLHATRHDRHAINAERPAGYQRRHVVHVVDVVG